MMILASVLVVTAAMSVIILPALFISWRFAVSAQETRLRHAAEHSLEHAEAIYGSAVTALSSLDGTELVPCSPEHIRLMMVTTLQSLYINNVAYNGGGFVRCNAHGIVDPPIPSHQVDVVQPDGLQLVVNWKGSLPGRGPLMLVKNDRYSALIDQRLLYQHLSDDPSQKFTFRTLNGIPIQSGDGEAFAPHPADDILVVLQSRDWTLAATTPRLGFLPYAGSLLTVVIPLAIALAVLIGAAVLWYLTRPVSGRAVIERALRLRQFAVHYQPIIELATHRCVAAEALVRLRGQDGILIRPDLFIPYAEEGGFIGRLTDQVLEIVVREMNDLLSNDRSLHISVNVGATDIVSGRILGALEQALKGSAIEPRQIWLEVTERGFVNAEGARATLTELHRRGYCVAIDDFGTGYSGLQYLQQLPIDMLKIDKAFIDTVGTAAPTSTVTGHIIAMARELRLGLVAEGVETEAQVAFLRERRVKYAQGWLFSPAIPADAFISFLRRNLAENRAPGAPDAAATTQARKPEPAREAIRSDFSNLQ